MRGAAWRRTIKALALTAAAPLFDRPRFSIGVIGADHVVLHGTGRQRHILPLR